MHYCFFTTAVWDKNASMVRPRELGAELFRRGHKVTFICDDNESNRAIKVPIGTNLVFIPPGGLLKQTFARRRAIREINPTYVHVLNPAPKGFLALAMLWGQKVVGDWDEWPAKRPNAFFKRTLGKFLDRWLRKRSTQRFVASKYMRDEFDKLGTPAIYLPYATYLQPQSETASPYTSRTFVYMGNLYPAYDHDLLFEAAELLQQRGLYPNIDFIGSGPDEQRWREFIAKRALGNVNIRGYVSGPELWARLRHAHVLVFPIRDGLLNRCRCPSKTYSYAQARRPILTNRVGEVPAVLGEKATYVDCTAKAFADAIATMMKQTLPDVDYGIERHNWGERVTTLLAATDKR